MKRSVICFLIVLFAFLLAGCWNYKEIDSMSVVAGLGVDLDPQSHEYILYIEIAEIKGSTQQQTTTSKVIETRGKTVFDALRNVIKIAGKRLYWAHAQIVIVSEEVAKQGVTDIIDWLIRDAEPRLTMHLLVVKDTSLKDLLSSERTTEDILSFEIHDSIENETSLSKSPKSELYRMTNRIASDTASAYAGVITTQMQEDKRVIDAGGTALFKKDQLKGFLDAEDTKYFLFALDQVQGGVLAKNEIAGNPKANVTLEIFGSHTQVTPIYQNGTFTMDIKTTTDTAIDENGTDADYINSPGRETMKDEMQQYLEENIIRVVKEVQSQYDTDIFGFGEKVYEDMPDLWDKIKSDWDEEFPKTQVSVVSEIKIRNSAYADDPLKKGR